MTTFRPGDVREPGLEVLRVLRARAAARAAQSCSTRHRHARGCRPRSSANFAAWLTIWSIASVDEVEEHDLDDRAAGRTSPRRRARPAIAPSVIGVSRTRAAPKWSSSPRVAPNGPPALPTSSPKHDDARVALHLLAERVVDRLPELQRSARSSPSHGARGRAPVDVVEHRRRRSAAGCASAQASAAVISASAAARIPAVSASSVVEDAPRRRAAGRARASSRPPPWSR